MGVMYLSFFDASIVLTALMTLAYFLTTYTQYSAAQQTKTARRRQKGARRVRASMTSAPAALGGNFGAHFLQTVTGYLSNQSGQIQQRLQHPAGPTATLAIDSSREFEVADATLPLTPGTMAFGQLGTILSWLLSATLVITLILRALITGHAPWVNLYEASIALATFVTLAYVWFEWRYKTRVLGVFGGGISLLLLVFAIWVGAAYNQAEPLSFHQITPALQDNPILTIHVSMMIVSYAFFIVAFACGVLMLIQGEGAKARYSWLPSMDASDELGYRAVTIGFPLLALGIILGAYWANYAWGHYWSWDPKETSALITWLVYAIYLHARGVRGWRGNGIAWLLIAGFAATLFTYFGVSFIIPGLHSYGGVK